MTQDEFLIRAKEKHNNFYDYSLVIYKNCKEKIKIQCPKHGVFEQIPDVHFRSGCRKCGIESAHNKQRSNTEEFIKKAKEIHFNKYDYSKVNYIDNVTKIIIICPKHGDFDQQPNNHLFKKGCPKCVPETLRKKFTRTQEDFIKMAIKKFGNKFDYSLVKYINSDTYIDIVCPIHGKFTVIPFEHLKKETGCPKCGRANCGLKSRKGKEYFLKKCYEKHKDEYKYFLKDDVLNHDKVEIECEKHGKFFQTLNHHIYQSGGCPKCNISKSKLEEFIKNFLNKINEKYKERDRVVIKPLEIDVLVIDKKIGIECHGIFWHSERMNSNKNCHLNKLLKAEGKGFKLIQIFENEIEQKPKIVKARLKSILNKQKYKIFGRKCEVKEISFNEKSKF
ncbi:MAG: DUF723 domain-containing protein, partial [Nanoarchaeota archaeon]